MTEAPQHEGTQEDSNTFKLARTESAQLAKLSQSGKNVIACFAEGNQELIVDTALEAIRLEGDLEEVIQQSPVLKALHSRFREEFNIVFEQVRTLIAVESTLGEVAIQGAKGKLSEFIEKHVRDLQLIAAVLTMPEDACRSFMDTLAVVPEVIVNDPNSPTEDEIETALEFKRIFEDEMKNRLRVMQIRIDNMLIMAAVEDRKKGTYAGHGSIGEKPIDDPCEVTQQDVGYYWIDTDTGKITFAAAENLKESIQLAITRMAEKRGLKVEFDEKKRGTVEAKRYAGSGYRGPLQSSYTFTATLTKVET